MNGISNLSFEELLLIISICFLIVIALQSIFLYIKKGERISIAFRHVSGFSVGIIDQSFMVIFNFQPSYSPVVVLFDYVAYSCWFLLIPNFFNLTKRYLYATLWIISSAIVNTLFEHSAWLILYGYLPYPTEPIIWTSFHTIIFYLGMHAIGTSIILIGFKTEQLKNPKMNFIQNKNYMKD